MCIRNSYVFQSITVRCRNQVRAFPLWGKARTQLPRAKSPKEANPMSTQNPSQNADQNSYAEETALTDLFGDHPKTKILAVLLGEARDVNITRIAEMGGMSRSTVYEYVDDLRDLGVVEQTRKVGGSPLYQINRDSDVAKKLAQLEWDLVEVYDET